MSDGPVGRAGFHVQHTKAVSERKAILHEAMRELDEDAVEYWAERNPNIVVADEGLNEAYVNGGDGSFERCSDWQQVLDYGQDRLDRVGRKIREDKLDKNGRMSGGTVTTTLIVAHLPKSMCREIPDYYPRVTRDGEPMLDPATGEQMMRSRWVARDRDEARRYFEDVLGYLSDEVLPGGQESVLGYDIQHSESTPHIQIVADAFADDPAKSGTLRAAASEAWFAHRDVRDENGRVMSGPAKMRRYHEGLKTHLIERGYDISADFDAERHLVGMGKDAYSASQDALSAAEARTRYNEGVEADLAVEAAQNSLERARVERRDAEVADIAGVAIEMKGDYEARLVALDERETKLEERELALNMKSLDVSSRSLAVGNREVAASELEFRLEQRESAVVGREVAAAEGREEGFREGYLAGDDRGFAQGHQEGVAAGEQTAREAIEREWPTCEQMYEHARKKMPVVWDGYLAKNPQLREHFRTALTTAFERDVMTARQMARKPPEREVWGARTVEQEETARRARREQLRKDFAGSRSRSRDDDGLSL